MTHFSNINVMGIFLLKFTFSLLYSSSIIISITNVPTDLRISLCSSKSNQNGSVNILSWTMFTAVPWAVRKYQIFLSQMTLITTKYDYDIQIQ